MLQRAAVSARAKPRMQRSLASERDHADVCLHLPGDRLNQRCLATRQAQDGSSTLSNRQQVHRTDQVGRIGDSLFDKEFLDR